MIGVLLAAGGLGGTAIIAMGDNSTMEMVEFFAAGYNFLPSVLFFIGLAAFALGWAPKLGKIIYVYLTYSFLLTYFNGIIDLPKWIFKTAIQGWVPLMPMENFDGQIFIIITIISSLLILIGYVGYNRRDIVEGA